MDELKGFPMVVLAADFPYDILDTEKEGVSLKPLLKDIVKSEDIAAIKIGSKTLGNDFTRREISNAIKRVGKKVIYDDQKLGQDIPDITRDLGALFAEVSDAVIVYPKTLEHWVAAYTGVVEDSGSNLITVFYMTDNKDCISKSLGLAAEISHHCKETSSKFFGAVLPANKLMFSRMFLRHFKYYDVHPEIFVVGITTQGGNAFDVGKLGAHYGIVGRALYNSDDLIKSAREVREDLHKGYKDKEYLGAHTIA